MGVNVKYGQTIKKLTSKSGASNICFEDGSVAHADMIIGADGRMSSAARKFVNGDNQPVYQGFINWIGIYEGKSPLFTDLEIKDYWGIGERFSIVPVSSTIAYWAAGVASDSIGHNIPIDYKSELLTIFQDWPEPVTTLIEKTSLTNINKVYVHDHNPIESWHRDNVLVIGDAAHAPLPTSGQGACQALEDAWHLGELLKNYNGNLEALFQKFTEIRHSKTSSIISGARQFAAFLFMNDKNASTQRNSKSISTDYDAMVNGMANAWSSELPMLIKR